MAKFVNFEIKLFSNDYEIIILILIKKNQKQWEK